MNNMGLKKRNLSVVMLAFFTVAALVAFAFAFVFEQGTRAAAETIRHDISTTVKSISPGVKETQFYTQNSSNDDQVVSYAIEIDMSRNRVIAGYTNYDTSGKWAMSTVAEQAAAAERVRGVNVVAAVNADFFNMGTGEPTGVLVMNGKQVKADASALAQTWFAVTSDGKAHIGTGTLPENTVEAVGGALRLIKDGEMVPSSSDSYYTTKQPRTAVGITADGDIVLVVADGRQSPYSSGYTYQELAEKMFQLGCVDAINLDGGGSTTYLAQYAGTGELTLANSPSDGQERNVSSSLLVVSNAEATGEFAEATISPVNQIYTPGSTVDFSAIGADTAGFPVDIPEDVEWRIAEGEEDSVSGQLSDAASDSVVFTGDADSEGVLKLEMVYNGEVVGKTEIEFRWPDTVAFSAASASLEAGVETDLGLTAQYEYRDVIFKDGDFQWTVTNTGDTDDPSQLIGEMAGENSNIFVTNKNAVNAPGTITVTLKADSNVTATVEVMVGVEPTVAWDFEDVQNEDGTVTPAEEYYSTGENGKFAISTVGGATAEATISSDYSRNGENSLRVYYDYRQATPTAGVYFGLKETFMVPNNPGKPTAIGVWVYVPSDMPNFWIRAYIDSYDSDGQKTNSGAQPINFTAQSETESNNFGIPYYETTIPAGWHYFEAPLANFVDKEGLVPIPGYQYGLMPKQSLRIMYVSTPPCGAPTNGYIYFDDFMFIYGANTEDVDPPEISNLYVNGEIVEDSVYRTDSNTIVFEAEYDGEVTGYGNAITQIDTDTSAEGRTKVYVDGNMLLGYSSLTTNSLRTKSTIVPNGTHIVTVVVADEAGNEARKSFTLIVEGESSYNSVYLEEEEPPYLNKDYKLNLLTTDLAHTRSVTFEIRLGLDLELESATSLLPEQFEVSFDQTNVIENIYEVTVTRKEGVTVTETGGAEIASLVIPVPKDWIEGVSLTYAVQSSTVVFDGQTVGEDEQIVNSISAQEVSQEVLAYYDFSIEPTIVGDEDGAIITVLHDGVPAAGVSVYMDKVLLGTTDEKGQIITKDFVSAPAIKEMYAEDGDGNVSFVKTIYGMTAMPADGTPFYIAAKAVADSETQQAISWLSNPLTSGEPVIRYATKAAYEKAGGTAEALAEIASTLNGSSQILQFDGFADTAQNIATRINGVTLTGLARDTEYVYQVGDGTTWSTVKNFSTTKSGENTNFFVIGDTQGTSDADREAVAAIAGLINASGIDYSFGAQTGDFIDSADSYEQWAAVLESFSGNFGNIDMIHTMGNHEYAGDAEGDFGAAINMLPDKKYYSVTYGNVYVAVINYAYTSNVANLQEALAWMVEDAQSSGALWKVLIMHQPPYYTNSTGGNFAVNDYVPAAVDEAGIDVVFSGHDHSYARTKPMTGGEVDSQNGAVYIISGSTGEKSYDVVETDSFNFDIATNNYSSIYLSVSASDSEFAITAYDVIGGKAQVFDSYTIYKNGSCQEGGHSWVYDGTYLTCSVCGASQVLPENFSGMVTNEDGLNMLFSNGELTKGWIQIGEDKYYFGDDGVAADGRTENIDNGYGDLFWFEFENGKLVGGQTGWAADNTRYFVDGFEFTGFRTIDGTIYYFMDAYSANATGNTDNVGRIGQGAVRIRVGSTVYTIYFKDDGSYDHGDFYQRWDSENQTHESNNWVYTRVREPSDPNASWIAYEYTGWFETEYGWFYAQPNAQLAHGDLVIDGVKYRFEDVWGDPRTTGNCVCLGRYYNVSFVSEDGNTTISEAEVFQNETVAAPDDQTKAGNSIKSYTFLGWFDGDTKYTSDMQITDDMTFEARFDTVYTENYNNMKDALDALAAAQDKTPAEKHAALDAATDVYETLSAEEQKDARAEAADLFELYDEMLGKLYEVTFGDGEAIIVYEGETVAAPANPTKDGNSIKSYTFAGWFDGDTKYTSDMQITEDMAFEAKFDTVYTDEYNAMKAALDALAAAHDKTPVEKHAALDTAIGAYEAMTETEIADAKAEGLTFELYDEMLGKLYEVTFGDGEAIIVYEGETVAAPANPTKDGNSIKSYTFAGWFDGDTKYTSDMQITEDMAFEAKFDTVYTDEYNAMKAALDALTDVESGSLEERYKALSAVYALMQNFSETERTDARAEAADSFELYDEMLAAYNGTADGASEDLDNAVKASDAFLSVMTAAATVLSLAAIAFVVKEMIL